LLETIYFTWFLFITVFFSNFIILSYIFFLWPPGGGACRFLYRANNMMQIICELLFVWHRKLVWSSSSRLCQTWHWSGCLSRILHDWMKTQKTTDQTIWNHNTKYWQANNNTKIFKSGTQMEQLGYNSTAISGPTRLLLDHTATSCCIQRFNLSLSHLSPFGCNKVTNSVKEVFVIPI
jgi:hypothetical protein